MKNFTESFDNKMVKYSLGAGAVLAGLTNISAQVWHQTDNYTLDYGGELYNLQFNGNNIARFVLYNPDYGGGSRTYVGLRVFGTYGSAIGGSGQKFKTLSNSYIIDSTKNFYNLIPGYQKLFSAKSSAWLYGSQFRNKTSIFGIRFKISGETKYAWIKITVPDNGASCTIVEHAYEQTTDLGIKAGETSVSLPVELTSFTASKVENKVLLNWQTATEINNYGFEIERMTQFSQVGNIEQWSDWEMVGFIPGHGTTNSQKNYSFTDSDLSNSAKVKYRLKQIDNDGEYNYSKVVSVDLNIISDIKDNVPNEFQLLQNYPNPFNPSTTIKFSIPEGGNVNLKVYNSLGEEVTTLINKELSAGNHEVEFKGNELPSGFYVYRIDVSGKYSDTKKMLLLK